MLSEETEGLTLVQCTIQAKSPTSFIKYCFNNIAMHLLILPGDDSELLHCDGYIILCVTDRRLSKKVCEARKLGTNCNLTFDFRLKIKKNVATDVNK